MHTIPFPENSSMLMISTETTVMQMNTESLMTTKQNSRNTKTLSQEANRNKERRNYHGI